MIYFQWVGGPRMGAIVKCLGTEIDNGELYVKFEDGTRCNRRYVALLNETNITNKMVAHISSLSNAWDIYIEDIPAIEEKYDQDKDGVRRCIQPYIPGKKLTRINKRPTYYHVSEMMLFDKEESFIDTSNNPTKEITDINIDGDKPHELDSEIISKNLSESTVQTLDNDGFKQLDSIGNGIINTLTNENPVHILCDKCKKVTYVLDTNIEILVPNVALYKIAEESFDNGGEDFINYIMDNLDVSIIKSHIKKSLTELYQTK